MNFRIRLKNKKERRCQIISRNATYKSEILPYNREVMAVKVIPKNNSNEVIFITLVEFDFGSNKFVQHPNCVVIPICDNA